MSYGINVINAEGETVIDNFFPHLVATTGIISAATYSKTYGSSSQWLYSNMGAVNITADDDEIIFVETPVGVGLSCVGYTSGTFELVGFSSYVPSTINYFKAKIGSSVANSTGYGIRTFDGNGATTFDSGHPIVNVRATGIIPGSSSNTSTPANNSVQIESAVNYVAMAGGSGWLVGPIGALPPGTGPCGAFYSYIYEFGGSFAYRPNSTTLQMNTVVVNPGLFTCAPASATGAGSTQFITAIV